MSLQSVSPATGEILARFKETAGQERDRILATAHAAYLGWRTVPFARAHTPEYARTMTLEMGKPMVQAEPRVRSRQLGLDRVAVPR